MSEITNQISLQDQILTLAPSSPERFSIIFRKYRNLHSEEVTQACLLHLGSHGLDKAGRMMIMWLCLSADYLPALLDSKLLSLETAKRVAAILYQADQQCLSKLVNLSEQSNDLSVRRLISRALELMDVFTNKDTLVPWLRQLTNSPDTRIRSKAVKTLCELRPNRQLIERQLESPEERIRANAVEAIWYQRTAEAEELLRSATHDPNHRVVANALVGLYLIGDKTAFDRIAELTRHSSATFRRASIWALGYIADRRGIALLESLGSQDQAPAVRSKALKTLTLFPPVALDVAPPPSVAMEEVAETLEATPHIAEEAVPSNTVEETVQPEEVQHDFGAFKLTLLS